MKSRSLPNILLLTATALATIAGGYLSTDLTAAPPGASFLGAVFGSAELPAVGPWVVSILICAAIVVAFARHRVLQIPFPPLTIGMLLFGITVLGSIGFTPFKGSAILAASQWLACIATFFAVVAIVGRNRGPSGILGAIALGSVVLAILGIIEYRSNPDPNWRIFAHWVNPNAAAGILGIGLFASLGLLGTRGEASRVEPDWSRIQRLSCILGAVLISAALYLTQSKGGLLAAAIGAILFLIFSVSIGRKSGAWKIAAAASILVPALGFGLGQAMVLSASRMAGEPGTTPRIAAAAQTQEQSAGFRRLLWQTAYQLAVTNPTGSGIGTFRYESTKPGLVPQTHHAHQGFLQLLVEVGALGMLVFVATLVLWIKEVFRGLKKLRPESAIPLSATMSALGFAFAHNMVDSDLQHFGTCFAVFALLGVGLQLASDGVTPEYFPPSYRRLVFGLSGFLAAFVSYAGFVDSAKAMARGSIEAGNRDRPSLLKTALSIAPFDGELWAIEANFAGDRGSALAALRKAAHLSPSMRNERVLARAELALERPEAAIEALERALRRDPFNLPALKILLDIFREQGKEDKAVEVAERLVRAEESMPFRVRAVPDSVPTETFEARLFLASRTADTRKRRELLLGAAKGYAEFAIRTVPQIVYGAKVIPGFRYAGDGVEEAEKAISQGRSAVAQLSLLESAGGVPKSDLAPLSKAFDEAEAALADLRK